jgi:hypothetical protein
LKCERVGKREFSVGGSIETAGFQKAKRRENPSPATKIEKERAPIKMYTIPLGGILY